MNRFNLHTATVGAALSLAAASAAAPTLTSDLPTQGALRIDVTARGQSSIGARLPEILAASDVNLKKRHYPELGYVMPAAQKLSGKLEDVRRALKDWLVGFRLKDPRLAGSIQNVSYVSEGLSMRTTPDYFASRLLGDDLGIVLKTEALLSEFRIAADKLRVRDLSNDYIGTFGANHPWISLAPKSTPLAITLLSRVQVRPGGEIDFETFNAQSNIEKLDLDFGFDSQLIIPKVEVEVNDAKSTLDRTQVARALRRNEDPILRAGQKLIAPKLAREIPNIVDSAIEKQFGKGIVMDLEFKLPGDAPTLPLLLRLGLQELKLTDTGLLSARLDGLLQDPGAPDSQASAPTYAAEPPSLKAMHDLDYDVAASIGADLLDQAMELAFARGAIAEFRLSNGKPIRMVSAPRVVRGYQPGTRTGTLQLQLSLQMRTGTIDEMIALVDPFVVNTVVEARLEHDRCGNSITLKVERVLPESTSVPNAFVKFDSLREDVAETVAESVGRTNTELSSRPFVLPDAFDIPARVHGVPIRLLDVSWDPSGTGYLSLFLSTEENQCP